MKGSKIHQLFSANLIHSERTIENHQRYFLQLERTASNKDVIAVKGRLNSYHW